MTYTHYADGNPLYPLVPMDVWLIIRKFKEELEIEEKMAEIRRLDYWIRLHRMAWKADFNTAHGRRESKYAYHRCVKRRKDIINE